MHFGNSTTRSYVYIDSSNTKITTFEDGAKTYETTDLGSNVIKFTEVDRDGNSGRTSYALYDADGMLTTSIEPNGLKKSYSYNTRGLLINEQDSTVNGFNGSSEYEAGRKSVYTYDNSGNRISEQRWIYQNRSVTSSYELSGLGWILSESVPYTNLDGTNNTSTVKYEYDRMGRIATTIDGNNIDRHT